MTTRICLLGLVLLALLAGILAVQPPETIYLHCSDNRDLVQYDSGAPTGATCATPAGAAHPSTPIFP